MSEHTAQHTCATSGRTNCEACVRFEVELWGAINHYVVTCGGDPARHVHGNTARMEAVTDISTIIDKVRAHQQINDIVVADLVKGSNAAAAAASDWRARAVAAEKRLAEIEAREQHVRDIASDRGNEDQRGR